MIGSASNTMVQARHHKQRNESAKRSELGSKMPLKQVEPVQTAIEDKYNHMMLVERTKGHRS